MVKIICQVLSWCVYVNGNGARNVSGPRGSYLFSTPRVGVLLLLAEVIGSFRVTLVRLESANSLGCDCTPSFS